MLSMYFARRLLASGLAMLLWGAVAALAQAAGAPLTFAAAVQRGLARAPQVEARAADVTATHEEAARAGRLPDPALTFGIASYPVTAPGTFSLRSDGMTMRTGGVMQIPAAFRLLVLHRLRRADHAADRASATGVG